MQTVRCFQDSLSMSVISNNLKPGSRHDGPKTIHENMLAAGIVVKYHWFSLPLASLRSPLPSLQSWMKSLGSKVRPQIIDALTEAAQ